MDMTQRRKPSSPIPVSDRCNGPDEPVYTEEERLADRAALVAELRAKVRSGEYRPSIGSISMHIAAELAED